jgi:polyisoprenoid-binding protein YceI
VNLVKERTQARKWGTRIGIPAAVVLLLVVGGPFVYINFISKDAPERLTLPPAQSSDATVPGVAGTALAGPAAGLDGKWTVAGGSQAGYRVKEVIFGQDNEAAGRTNRVTGEFTLSGTTVQAATVTVDMTSLSSDEDRRDSQVRGRIMSTGTFPTSTFTLAQPISVPSIPAENVDSKVQANGQLTLRGVTRPVVADLQARRTGGKIQVAGSIPIKFDDWNIPNPSSPGITTQDNGLVEFLLTFTKA